MLNKETIANLNHHELQMVKGRGMNNVEPVGIGVDDGNSDTCSPIDTGVTPFNYV
jgi:hypothetical protein